MNDPRTCVYAQQRRFGDMGGRAVCLKLNGPCLCGLDRPAPSPTGRLPDVYQQRSMALAEWQALRDVAKRSISLDDYSPLERRVAACLGRYGVAALPEHCRTYYEEISAIPPEVARKHFQQDFDPWDEWKPGRGVA